MSVNVTLVPAGSPFKSIADLRQRELIVGGTTASGFTSVIQTVANNIGGTRMKLVYGYPASPESCLAMERGELGGCTPSWTFVKTARRQWLDPANATLLLQYGVGRHPELPDLPAMTELSDAPDDRKALAVFGSASEVGRSFVAPPGVPADRLAALRAAFSAASADPEFLAEARKAGLDLDILAGEALQKLVVDLGSISPDIAERARKAHAPTN